ncbi:MAG TPA: hypothetical protein VGT41_01225 [Candidatus Babeliales bacterium]|nr:hypothetical protein [Candidatus Babeliales bacterium]
MNMYILLLIFLLPSSVLFCAAPEDEQHQQYLKFQAEYLSFLAPKPPYGLQGALFFKQWYRQQGKRAQPILDHWIREDYKCVSPRRILVTNWYHEYNHHKTGDAEKVMRPWYASRCAQDPRFDYLISIWIQQDQDDFIRMLNGY